MLAVVLTSTLCPLGAKANVETSPTFASELQKVRSDPAPPSITRDTHYVISNEDSHELFRPSLKELGGIHIGVGAEQNYLLAAWAKSDALVLLDFDGKVVDLHEVYGAIFRNADTPEQFLDLWSADATKRVVKLIDSSLISEGKQRRARHAHKWFRKKVHRHLVALRDRYADKGVACFLTDAGQYKHLARLWRDGRVLAVRGDLTAKRAMADIAALAKRHSVIVRSLYLSNAEFYFRFNRDRYTPNILGLPFDERSIVLRTYPYEGFSYRYIEQTGLDFQSCLRGERFRRVKSMLELSKPTDKKDHFTLGSCD